jgi:hypothetical protein
MPFFDPSRGGSHVQKKKKIEQWGF